MTLISSHRPHQGEEEYRTNQIRALRTWEVFAERIVYFGDFEMDLTGPKTTFVPSEQWPRIVDMARYAYDAGPVAAIVNSDIVLKPEVARVFDIVRQTPVGAVTSRRFDLESGKLDPNDKGRDIFICKRRVWGMFAAEVPRCCRMGHQKWDAFAVAFFRKKLGKRFGEFSQMRVVFHPRHEGRKMPYSEEMDISGPYEGFWDQTQDMQIV